MIPENHILIRIKKKIDFSFVEEETKDLYSQDFGRPAYPAGVIFRMLFLEFYYNLSDIEVAKQCQYNLLYRWFVGLKVNEPTPDDTSLVVFRKRLGEKRFERLFNHIVKQAQDKGLLKERLKIVDASKIIADVALPNTVNLLKQGRKKIIKEIERETRKEPSQLKKKYVEKTKTLQKPTREELAQEVEKSLSLVREVKGRYSSRIEELATALEKISKGVKEDRIVSFSDLDARGGYTAPKKPFVGYKAHIAEDESEIVTSCELLKGNQNEGKELKKLLVKEEDQGLFPRQEKQVQKAPCLLRSPKG